MPVVKLYEYKKVDMIAVFSPPPTICHVSPPLILYVMIYVQCMNIYNLYTLCLYVVCIKSMWMCQLISYIYMRYIWIYLLVCVCMCYRQSRAGIHWKGLKDDVMVELLSFHNCMWLWSISFCVYGSLWCMHSVTNVQHVLYIILKCLVCTCNSFLVITSFCLLVLCIWKEFGVSGWYLEAHSNSAWIQFGLWRDQCIVHACGRVHRKGTLVVLLDDCVAMIASG